MAAGSNLHAESTRVSTRLGVPAVRLLGARSPDLRPPWRRRLETFGMRILGPTQTHGTEALCSRRPCLWVIVKVENLRNAGRLAHFTGNTSGFPNGSSHRARGHLSCVWDSGTECASLLKTPPLSLKQWGVFFLCGASVVIHPDGTLQ